MRRERGKNTTIYLLSVTQFKKSFLLFSFSLGFFFLSLPLPLPLFSDLFLCLLLLHLLCLFFCFLLGCQWARNACLYNVRNGLQLNQYICYDGHKMKNKIGIRIMFLPRKSKDLIILVCQDVDPRLDFASSHGMKLEC